MIRAPTLLVVAALAAAAALTAPRSAAEDALEIVAVSWEGHRRAEQCRGLLERAAGCPVSIAMENEEHPLARADVAILQLSDDRPVPPLLDLTTVLAGSGIDPARFAPASLAPWRAGAQLVALPITATPVLLAWRAALAHDLGVDPAGARTWEDFAAIGRELRRRHPEVSLIRLSLRPWTLSVLLRQRGVPIIDADGRPAFDTRAGAAVIAWVVGQLKGPAAIACSGHDRELVAAGRVLCVMADGDGMQQVSALADHMGAAFAVAPLPRWSAGGLGTSASGDDAAVGIVAASRHPTAAWAVARVLATDAQALAACCWQERSLPAWQPLWELPLFAHPEARFTGAAWGAALIAVAAELPPRRRGESQTVVEDALIAAGKAAEGLIAGGAPDDPAAALLPALHRLCGHAP